MRLCRDGRILVEQKIHIKSIPPGNTTLDTQKLASIRHLGHQSWRISFFFPSKIDMDESSVDCSLKIGGFMSNDKIQPGAKYPETCTT